MRKFTHSLIRNLQIRRFADSLIRKVAYFQKDVARFCGRESLAPAP